MQLHYSGLPSDLLSLELFQSNGKSANPAQFRHCGSEESVQQRTSSSFHNERATAMEPELRTVLEGGAMTPQGPQYFDIAQSSHDDQEWEPSDLMSVWLTSPFSKCDSGFIQQLSQLDIPGTAQRLRDSNIQLALPPDTPRPVIHTDSAVERGSTPWDNQGTCLTFLEPPSPSMLVTAKPQMIENTAGGSWSARIALTRSSNSFPESKIPREYPFQVCRSRAEHPAAAHGSGLSPIYRNKAGVAPMPMFRLRSRRWNNHRQNIPEPLGCQRLNRIAGPHATTAANDARTSESVSCDPLQARLQIVGAPLSGSE